MEWQLVFSNEGCNVDFSCSDVFLYIHLETGSSDGRLAGHTMSKVLVFFWSYVMFKFMNPATCNREIRLANIATDKRGPLFAWEYIVSFPLRMPLAQPFASLGTGSDSLLLAPTLILARRTVRHMYNFRDNFDCFWDSEDKRSVSWTVPGIPASML